MKTKDRLLRGAQTKLAYLLGRLDSVLEKHDPMLDSAWDLLSELEGLEDVTTN